MFQRARGIGGRARAQRDVHPRAGSDIAQRLGGVYQIGGARRIASANTGPLQHAAKAVAGGQGGHQIDTRAFGHRGNRHDHGQRPHTAAGIGPQRERRYGDFAHLLTRGDVQPRGPRRLQRREAGREQQRRKDQPRHDAKTAIPARGADFLGEVGGEVQPCQQAGKRRVPTGRGCERIRGLAVRQHGGRQHWGQPAKGDIAGGHVYSSEGGVTLAGRLRLHGLLPGLFARPVQAYPRMMPAIPALVRLIPR